ncbi:MAG: enoyl-CoA hydratase/isomerase family protein [Anaerostipes sp.]
MSELVLLEKNNGVAVIRLNNPKTGNSLDYDMYISLRDKLKECEDNKEIRAIVVTGEGKNFSTGGDIRGFLDRIEKKTFITQEEAEIAADTGFIIRKCKKPTIAMVNHAAAGAGCSIACACDFRIVTPSSNFIMAFINVGLPGDTDGLYFLTRLVGVGRASDIMMTGRAVGGEEAYQMGLATRVVDEDALEVETMKMARKLSKMPGRALECQKALFNNYFYGMSEKAYAQDEAKYTVECSRSADFEEAVHAFIEKRRPVFGK